MTAKTWIGLNERERELLIDALSRLPASHRRHRKEIDSLTLKLLRAKDHPEITIGVHGGQVQWTLGNPFPIRICDYDGEKEELPDVDERGERCRIWLEPPNKGRKAA